MPRVHGVHRTILADPPWHEQGGGKCKRGADKHYPLMKTKAICAMSLWLEDYIYRDAHLHLWVTNNHLVAGLDVMEAWGFRYINQRTWAKDKIGLGQYARGQTEHILFGVRGKACLLRPNPYVSTLIGGKILPRTVHSRKPPEAREEIERMSPGPYLELFARERVEGWSCWGNEVDSDIEEG